jgi:hypothetical protein
MLNDQVVALEYPFWTACLLKYLIAPQTTFVKSVRVGKRRVLWVLDA